jgi:hypothetical protein
MIDLQVDNDDAMSVSYSTSLLEDEPSDDTENDSNKPNYTREDI